MKYRVQLKQYQTPIDQMKGNIIHKPWEQTKLLFMRFAPRTPEGQELTVSKNTEDTGVASVAQKAPRSRINDERRCEFCNRVGHTIEECRTKLYNGTRYPNDNCRQWVLNGREVHLEDQPKEQDRS